MDHYGFICELKYWLDSNIDHANKINDVARKAGYSKWHLQRLFKKMTGEKLGTYIRKRRLLMAAEALRQTDQSVLDISLAYGFNSQQTFTRAFKKHFQCPPARYRRENFDSPAQPLNQDSGHT